MQDQLARDLGAGAERADADVAARKLFRHDAHGELAETEPAVLLRQRQAEHAELGDLLDDLERNVGVLQVPLVGMRHDFGFREAAHLFVDRRHRFVEAGIAERRRALLVLDELGELGLHAFRAAGGNHIGHSIFVLADFSTRHAERLGADDFELAHRNAARDLRAVLAEGREQDELFRLTEVAFLLEANGPQVHLAQRFDGGREPGEAVRRVLRFVDAADFLDPRADARLGEAQDAICGFDHLGRAGNNALGPSRQKVAHSTAAMDQSPRMLISWVRRARPIAGRHAQGASISGCHVQISEPGRQDISCRRDRIARA